MEDIAQQTTNTNDTNLAKLQALPWTTLEHLLLFVLGRVFATDAKIDRADITHVISFFGSIFTQKQIISSTNPKSRNAALNCSKVFILKRAVLVAKRKHRTHDELVALIRKWLKSISSKSNHSYKRKRLLKELGWLDSAIRSESLFSESYDYILTKFGAQIQSKWLLDRFAQQIALAFFRTAQSSQKLDLSSLDPYLGSEHFTLVIAIVLVTNDILEEAALSIKTFNPSSKLDSKTLKILGKILMLTQKRPLLDVFQNIFGNSCLNRPLVIPNEWCEYLAIHQDYHLNSSHIFAKLRHDVKRFCLNRFMLLVNTTITSTARTISESSAKSLLTSKSDLKFLARYLTELAFVEIVRARRIPVFFHVLKTAVTTPTSESSCNHIMHLKKLDAFYLIYQFDPISSRFEQIEPDLFSAQRTVIAIRNIWYGTSDSQFDPDLFVLEDYFESWRGHDEAFTFFRNHHRKQSNMVTRFYGKKLEPGDDFERLKMSNFLVKCDVYASTIEVETNWSLKLNAANWNEAKIRENMSVKKKLVETKLHNRRLWEEANYISDSIASITAEIRLNSMLNSLAEKIARNYFEEAKTNGRLHVAELDPLVGDTSCQVRATVIACFSFLAKAAKDIHNFDLNQIDRRIVVYLGKCLMLTQKISFDEIAKGIVGIVHQRTPVYMPSTWCEYLSVRKDNAQFAKRVFILLKRSVARESLARLHSILVGLENTHQRRCLMNFMSSSRRDSSSLGIEMSPLYLTEIAMIEVARHRRIPLAMHILEANYRQSAEDAEETIRIVKWHLLFFVYSFETRRFERVPAERLRLKPHQLVIAVENIWYEGSEPSLNYGPHFLHQLDLDGYVQSWTGHPELTAHLEKTKRSFCARIMDFGCDNKSSTLSSSAFDFSACVKYLELKEMLGMHSDAVANDLLEQIKRMSFMFCSHFYASTCGGEIEFSQRLNAHEWTPVRFEAGNASSHAYAQDSSLNRRLWDRKSKVNRRSFVVSLKIRKSIKNRPI